MARVVCVLATLATACTVPARTATLEREQARLREEVAAQQARLAQLEDKVGGLAKRLGTAAGPKAAKRTLEQRLGVIEQGRDDAEAMRATETPPAPPVVRDPTPTPQPTALPELDLDGLRRESARELPSGYRRGIDYLRTGAYEDAIRALRDFVRVKHDSPFAGGAHYWIGQASMQLGQFYQAILAFTEAQQRTPLSDYATSAGFASGLAFLHLGNVTEARRAFEKVIADAPDTPEAAKASARLRELERPAR